MFNRFKKCLSTILVSLVLFAPDFIFGATLNLDVVSDVKVDNSVLLELFVDPQSNILNVVEGEIRFSGKASENLSVQVENGQSVLSIWPVPPVYDSETKSIVFTGGVPNGFGTKGLLFRLRIKSEISEDINISYLNTTVYLNDGNGTQESIKPASFKITTDKNGKIELFDISSGFSQYKYVIILLILIIFLSFVAKNAIKKNLH